LDLAMLSVRVVLLAAVPLIAVVPITGTPGA
jgi:hypothetical protein